MAHLSVVFFQTLLNRRRHIRRDMRLRSDESVFGTEKQEPFTLIAIVRRA